VFRSLTITSPVVAGALLIAGLLATTSAWRYRHPDTTSDFTLFYVSAEHSTPQMYAHPPGPPRGNMNPPLFQLLLRPLTKVSLPMAATIWRGLNLASLLVCVWWLAHSSEERWGVADYAVLLAWAPMASTIALNQLTWILWPLLLATWGCWRRNRWTAGAIAYGIVLSLKPFLGVFLLWLLVQRQWRAAIVSMASAAAAFGVGLAVYGLAVNQAWVRALGDVTWAYAGMNASLQGMLTRVLTMPVKTAEPLVVYPDLVRPLALLGGAAIVAITLLRTRQPDIDRSWTPLMVSALLASPLGWLYYIWWVVPGTKPSRLLLEAPLLWVPMGFPLALAPNGWLTLTLGSVYFWGLFSLWFSRVYVRPVPQAASDDDRPPTMPFSRFSLATVVLVGLVIGASAIVWAQQSVSDDPAVGTWVLNHTKSTLPPDSAIEARTVTFTIVGDTMEETIVTRSGGIDSRVTYRGRYDGKDVSVLNAVSPTVAMKRRDKGTVESTWKFNDDRRETQIRSVSPDRRTLTIAVSTRDGSEHNNLQVYDRQF
jgi:hypothetical protein